MQAHLILSKNGIYQNELIFFSYSDEAYWNSAALFSSVSGSFSG